MNNLALHIEYLLRHHDCVTVPGLGAFIALRSGATIDGSRLLPPGTDYSFNPAVRNDDGLLASSYARRGRMAFEQGRLMLADDVARLRNALQTEREVSVGRLGSLELTADDTLLFRPLRSKLDVAEAIGMAPLSLAATPVEADEPEQIVETAPTAATDETGSEQKRVFDTDRNWYIPVNKVFARAAACFLVLIGITLSVWVAGYHTQNKAQFASPLPADRPVEQVKPKPKKSTVKVTSVPAAQPSAAATAAATEEPKEKYHLIVATFRSTAEAEKFISMASDSRLSIIASGKTVRVSAMSGADKEPLLHLMRDAEFKSAYSQSWIWADPKVAD